MEQRNTFYIIGDDPTSRINELDAVLAEIVGDNDRSLCVEDFDLSNADGESSRVAIIESAVTSLLSPPFLTPFRVVVLRDIGSASSDEVESLIKYFKEPSASSFLVALQGGGRISTQLTKAWKPYVIQRGNSREGVHDLFARLSRENSIKFAPGVKEIIISHCGEDSSQLTQIFERLIAVYGAKSQLSLEDVNQYLGQAGNVAIYQLANEICQGNISSSLDIVSRMLNSTSSSNEKTMHPLQIISLLGNHFRKLSILCDPSICNQNDAFEAIGKKGNPYGAKKSWELARSLGSTKIMDCIEIIGSTDVAIKGASALEGNVSVELCIISLCQICERGNNVSSALVSEHNEALFL